MYVSIKTDCYYRRHGNIGHLCRPIIGLEEVVDETGVIFLDVLTYEPREIGELVSEIISCFENVTFEELMEDAKEFYTNLSKDAFLNTASEINGCCDEGFKYKTLLRQVSRKDINNSGELSSERFLRDYSMVNPFLQTFHIELTSKCNERCVHCYIPHECKDTDIEDDLMFDILEQCRKMEVMHLVFSGGEPMSHPSFCDFVKRAKDLDFSVTILSNLTLLTDEIVKVLQYKHPACVNVSLYSMNTEVHDSITKLKGSFERTKNNIIKLVNNNIAVQINCPVMQQNKDSFYEVIKWGQEHRCAVVTDYVIMARSDRTTDNLEYRLKNDDIKYVVEKIAENSEAFNDNFGDEGISVMECKTGGANPEERMCGVALSTMCMVAKGDVYPCPGWQQYICGNANDTSLQEIWKNSHELNYLRGLRLKDFGKCVGCEDYDYCLMCVSRNYNESENNSMFDIPQITCDAAKIHHSVVKGFCLKK